MKLSSVIPLLASAGCIREVSIIDRPCPCAAGWTCEPSTQTCVREPGQDAGSSPTIDAGAGSDGRGPGSDGGSRSDAGGSGSDGGSSDGGSSDGGVPVQPTVTFEAKPSDPSNLAVATFRFAADDLDATFACKIDTGPFAPCDSPFDSPPLADGMHNFTVRATNRAARSGFAEALWAIDTVVPVVSISTGPSGLTGSSIATFAFTTDDVTAALACELDGGGFAPCESPDTRTGLADGAHIFKVRALDPAHNAAIDQRSWSIDTALPVITFTSGPSNIDIADRTPAFTFTVADAASIECQTDDRDFSRCSSPFTTPSLADGSHSVTVRATNDIGNAATATRAFHVDTVAPVVEVAAVASPSGVSPIVAFTASDTRALRITECRVDDGVFAQCFSPFAPPPLGNGSHTVFVRARDRAGNTTVDSTSFTVSAPPYRHTIRLDGSNDFFLSGERGEIVGTTSNSASTGFVLAYVTWDADNLYLAWETFIIGDAPDPRKTFSIYVDVDPGSAAGAASAQPFGTQAANLPAGFLADYRLRWATDGAISLARYDGAAWQELSTAGVQVAAGSAFLELAVPLARLGSPARFGLLGLWQMSGNGIERTLGGWFPDAFADGDYRAANPAPIAHWLDADLASPIPPGAPTNKR